MKNIVNISRTMLLFGISLFYFTQLKAQHAAPTPNIHVVIEQNGKRTVLDTVLLPDQQFDLKAFLKENNIEPTLKSKNCSYTKTITMNIDGSLPPIPPVPPHGIKWLKADTMIIREIKFKDCVVNKAETLAIPRYEIYGLEESEVHLKELAKLTGHLKDSLMQLLPNGLILDNEAIQTVIQNESDSVTKFTKIIIVTKRDKNVPVGKDLEEQHTTSAFDKTKENRLLIYPNPNNGQFKLVYEATKKGTIAIKITNVNYQTVFSEKIKIGVGKFEKEVVLSNQPKGTYIVTIEQGDMVLSKKILIE